MECVTDVSLNLRSDSVFLLVQILKLRHFLKDKRIRLKEIHQNISTLDICTEANDKFTRQFTQEHLLILSDTTVRWNDFFICHFAFY